MKDSIGVVGRIYSVSYPWWARALKHLARVLQRMAEKGACVQPWGGRR